jgi:hypothetical protein
MNDHEKLADELELLVKIWQNAKWWQKWSAAHVLAVKVWYRLGTITTALRDEKVNK